jgi:hypothetical protein
MVNESFMLSNDGYIVRDEMASLLQNCLNLTGQEEEGEDGIKVYHKVIQHFILYQDLIDITLKKMDVDRDGRICHEDFEKAVQDEPLLLEAFGPCLPRASALDTFLKVNCPPTFPSSSAPSCRR